MWQALNILEEGTPRSKGAFSGRRVEVNYIIPLGEGCGGGIGTPFNESVKWG